MINDKTSSTLSKPLTSAASSIVDAWTASLCKASSTFKGVFSKFSSFTCKKTIYHIMKSTVTYLQSYTIDINLYP